MVTTGSNTNAGSGTGNNADVTSTNGNWGGSGTLGRFTAASGTPFSAVLTGQMASIYLDAAAGAVFVSSVIAVNGGGASIDVDTTTIKWGTSPSTATTGRSCKIGGAWADLGVVTSLFASGTAPLSTRINIKAGTYANTTTNRTFGMSGTATVLIWWRGYQTTIGDQDTNNTCVAGTNIPAITFTTGQWTMSGTHQIFSSLDNNSQCTTAGGAINCTGNFATLYRFRSVNTAVNAAARAINFNGAVPCRAIACYFKATTTCSIAVNNANSVLTLLGDVITGGIIGYNYAGNTGSVNFTVFDSQAGDAISIGTAVTAVVNNCSIYNPGGHGITLSATLSASGDVISNNYFENVNQASKAAINNASGTNSDLIIVSGNAYFNCTSNTSGITENFAVLDNPTLASQGFNNPGSQDFSLKPIAKALAYPGLFECITNYQGYLDPGAVQRKEKGSSCIFLQ